jgi:hypothetical protein
MNSKPFVAIPRSLTLLLSRRDALPRLSAAGLAALCGSPHEIAARRQQGKKRKKKRKEPSAAPPPTTAPPSGICVPDCAGKSCGRDGCGGACGSCPDTQICQRGSCVCAPEPPETTCAARCGIRPNNCGQFVACPGCNLGQTCLSNGTCGIDCPGACPTGCVCTASVEGPQHCAHNPLHTTCTFRPCTSTAECGAREHCQETLCGPAGTRQNQCWPLCTN